MDKRRRLGENCCVNIKIFMSFFIEIPEMKWKDGRNTDKKSETPAVSPRSVVFCTDWVRLRFGESISPVA